MKPYSQQTLIGLLGNFDLAGKAYAMAPLHIGYINDTFLVYEKETPKYVLQRINHTVFKDVDGLMGNIEKALLHLQANDYKKIGLVATRTGKSYLKEESGYWRLMTYLENSISYNTTTSTQIAKEAGRIIGKFHVLLANADVSDYVDTIPQFHDLELRGRQFAQSLSAADTGRRKKADGAITFAQNMLSTLLAYDFSALPARVCHNDTKFNNVLFSKENGVGLCLIDLDTLMKGHFLYDFGDAVRTITNTALEDEKELHKITFDPQLFIAFVDGLALHGPFLRDDEIGTLHLGAVLMPFLHGIRALTDYLSNDIYYKVAYEDQNLDRCLSLFNYTQKAFGQLSFMQQEIFLRLKPI